MPPVYYAPTTNTTLTPEEEAALAAQAQQQAAPDNYIPGSTYVPDAPPAAEPVQPPPATAVASEQYYAPAEPEPYTSISPQITDTSNPSVEPGMSAPPSERRDSYTAVNQAYQPAPEWTSISPQDADNASRNAYPVSVSDFRDPIKTPEAQIAQETRYSPADPGRENTPSFGDNFVTSLGTSLGLDPKDPNEDMYNQLTRRLYDWAGDRIPEVGRTVGETALREVPAAINRMYLDPLRQLASPVTGAGNLSGPIANLVRAEWGLAEDIVGPHGNLLRQIQSTADPLGEAISGLTQPKTDALRGVLEEGKRNWDTFNDRVSGVSEGKEDVGQAIDDFLSFPLPSFGMREPEPVDLDQPDASWILRPGGVASRLAFEAGKAGRSRVDEALGGETAQALTANTSERTQRAKGAAIGARMRGGNTLDAALSAAAALAPDELPSLPSGELRDLIPAAATETIDTSYKPAPEPMPGKVSSYTPREPDAPEPVVIPARSNEIFTNEIRWPWWRDEEPEPQGPQTSSVRTSRTVVDPMVIERAREAATAAKTWAAGLNMPDVALPSITLPFRDYLPQEPTVGEGAPLPVRRTEALPTVAEGAPLPVRRTESLPTVEDGAPLTVRRTGPEGIDPNALYMPLPPEPSLTDRLRSAGTEVAQGLADRLPDVTLPGVSVPDVSLSLPGGGDAPADAGQRWAPPGTAAPATPDPLQQVFTEQASGATRSASQPEGTSIIQSSNGLQWVLGPNGTDDYRGIVDPNTGEYVTWPEDATPEQIESLISSIVSTGSPAANPAPGPATAAQPATTTTTSTGNTTNTATNASGGSTTRGSSGNGGGGGSTSSGRATRSSTRDTTDEDEAPLKLEDFLQDFDGDGVISKRDRMQAKRAFEEAKAARSKRRRGKGRGKNTRFPFNERRSALGQQIAADVANALAGKKG